MTPPPARAGRAGAPRAVRFDRHGPVDVLELVEVDRPAPGPGQVLVEVVATSVNPGEILVREGAFATTAPATFPSGQGSDLAGRVVEVGDGVADWSVGDEVLGWTDQRAAQAELVAVPAGQLTARPPSVPWEQAGSLYVAGGTAVAMAAAVPSAPGSTAVVLGAAGGVGSILTQLLVRDGVRVLAVVGAANAAWARSVGAEPVPHGDGLERRLGDAAPQGLAAAYDAHGGGYVDLVLRLGVPVDRVVTIIDFAGAERTGARTVFGHHVTTARVLADLAGLIASGELTVPIAATFPLARVREAYALLAERHTRGKIVLVTGAGPVAAGTGAPAATHPSGDAV